LRREGSANLGSNCDQPPHFISNRRGARSMCYTMRCKKQVLHNYRRDARSKCYTITGEVQEAYI
jgi:hypothetical protein